MKSRKQQPEAITKPILPKATAVWLIENTSLTFKQIAEFCKMHELEVKGIADGDVVCGVMGLDPVFVTRQLSAEEIERCTHDPSAKLQMLANKCYETAVKNRKIGKYTAIARRQDKPDAIYWLLKNCPDIQDGQIAKLIGTTKTTIATVRDKTHWNMKNIRPRDPVLLGICSQTELDKLMSLFQQEDTEGDN